MSKESKKTNKTKNSQNTGKSIIPQKYLDALLVLLIGLLVIIFFRNAIFDGSLFGGTDTISGECFVTYWEQAKKEGNFPLWMPYIFGGMPGYAAMIGEGTRYWDVFVYVIYGAMNIFKEILDSHTALHAFWYILMGIGMYFLMRQYKLERLISLFAAIAFTFCTGVIIWSMIGHAGKTYTFPIAIYVFIIFERLKERFSLLNVALLFLIMHIMFAGGHIQMMFYACCAFAIYLLVELITQIIKKGYWLTILKITGVLIIAMGFAFLMSADRYFAALEYTPYSTRGSASITARMTASNDSLQTALDKKKSADKDYEYSTMWSNSPAEMINFFVPSYHGFGKVDYSGPLTGNREVKIMTYWGQKPFEDATPYMGATVMFLALLGMIRYFRTNILIKSMTIIMFFGLLLSFGYTFPILYDLFFYYFPKFSSFRAPVMALILMHLTVPILAAFGLKALCEMNEKFGSVKTLPKEDKYPFMIFIAAIGLFIASGLIFSAAFEHSYILSVTNSKALSGYGEQALSILAQFTYDNLMSDWKIIGFLCIIIAGMSYFFVNRKLPKNAFLVGVIVIVLIDLWRVGCRPMEIVDKKLEKEPFPRTDVINFIIKDRVESNERFRVCDMSQQVINSPMYFLIENINGYHPAKLRVFQDMMDVMCQGSTSVVSHPFLWNMMNAKYIISNQQLGGAEPLFRSQQTGAFVYYNWHYCKRVFFVDSVVVADDITILNNMNESNFNPKTLAYIEKPLDKEIVPSGQYDAEMKKLNREIELQRMEKPITGDIARANQEEQNEFIPTAQVMDYKNEYIKIQTETKGQHLLVLSEIYVPTGWTAYIDGQETEIYKTNFGFRSIVVPAGSHTLEFKYVSKEFLLGKKVSTGTNIILILALIGGFVLENKRKKKNLNNGNEKKVE